MNPFKTAQTTVVPSRTTAFRRGRASALTLSTALALGLALTGCAGGTPGSTHPDASSQQADAAERSITFENAWAKATAETAGDIGDAGHESHGTGDADADAGHAGMDMGMSAVFGVLTNHGAEDIVLESAETDIAGVTELHETVVEGGVSTMRPLAGGITIPAGGSVTLEPGGTHIMLMELREPVLAGAEVRVTLRFSDGSSRVVTVLGKDFAGANEQYDGGSGADGHEDTEHAH